MSDDYGDNEPDDAVDAEADEDETTEEDGQ
jgi:hypothetical protein